MEKKINVRQFSIIGFLASISLKITVLPSFIFKDVGINCIFIIFLLFVLDFISFIFIYYLLKKNQNVTFYTFLTKSLGKVIAKIICFLIFVFFFFKLLFLLEGGYTYAKEVIFQEASLFRFSFILLSLSGSLYLFKLKSFARTVEFFYPIMLALLLIFLVIPLLTAEMYDIRPILEISSNKFFSALFKYLMMCGDFTYMLLFMGKVKFSDHKSNFKGISFRLILAAVLIVIFYYIFSSIFKYTGFLHSNGISEIVQFLPVPTVLGNFDWLTILLMMLLFSMQGGLFTYGMNYSLHGIFNHKGYKKDKNDKWVLLVSYTLVVIFISLIINSLEKLLIIILDYLKYLGVFFILVPIVLFFIDYLIRRKRRANEKNN